MKVAIVVGTRPEAIKMAPIYWAMKASKRFRPILIDTGQHSSLLKDTLESIKLEADENLDIMIPNQTLSSSAARILIKVSELFERIAPNLVLVQGDTTSAFHGAVAAFYQGIRVGHVEAGLRTKSISEPFPEEAHRRAISVFSSLDFCPTYIAKRNLMLEGKSGSDIFVTGNTGIDMLRITDRKLLAGQLIPSQELTDLVSTRSFILVTCHRRESFGQPLKNILLAIKELALEFPNINFVMPIHPNPNVKSVVQDSLNNITNVMLIDPLSYTDLVFLLRKTLFVITDSGGLQEEATAFGKQIIVLRQDSERMEAVNAGYAVLVGTDRFLIKEKTREYINLILHHNYIRGDTDIFGDGNASLRILEAIETC